MGNVFTFFGIAKPKKMFVYTQPCFVLFLLLFFLKKRTLLNEKW